MSGRFVMIQEATFNCVTTEQDRTDAPYGIQNKSSEHQLTCTGEGSGNNYAYLVTDDKTKQAVIIDPANPSESVSNYQSLSWNPADMQIESCHTSRKQQTAVSS
jgi:1,4-alpha-glucan branching enzyme